MQISPDQAEKVREWAAGGASLSDIQTRLADEFGIRLSYLDTRFLLIDLKVDLAEKPEKKPVVDPLAPAPGAPGTQGFAANPDSLDEPEALDDAEEPENADGAHGPAGSVSVEVDRIQRPGFAASGSITCSDGVKGEWGIDNYGRMALAFPDNKGYRPSAADQQAFVMRLQSLLAGY